MITLDRKPRIGLPYMEDLSIVKLTRLESERPLKDLQVKLRASSARGYSIIVSIRHCQCLDACAIHVIPSNMTSDEFPPVSRTIGTVLTSLWWLQLLLKGVLASSFLISLILTLFYGVSILHNIWQSQQGLCLGS